MSGEKEEKKKIKPLFMKLFGDRLPEMEIKTGMSSWEKDGVYRGGKQRRCGWNTKRLRGETVEERGLHA